jgi:ABC-type multidrug transport system ATPase subunit
MPLLTADSVGKEFGGRRVLTAASLRVVEGEVRALVGRNGAGKSTLVRIAAGVIAPDHGIVIWREQRMQQGRLYRLARAGLLLLPADGLLVPDRRLADQLRLFADTFGNGSVEEALVAMRLESCAAQFVHQLSGGEKRRADLAVALVRAPACLLADEVLRGLAPLDAELIGQVLRTLAARGCAVLITGHELPFLMRFSDHVTWCTNGTTHELGSPNDAERHDAFRAEYLGQPWQTGSD